MTAPQTPPKPEDGTNDNNAGTTPEKKSTQASPSVPFVAWTAAIVLIIYLVFLLVGWKSAGKDTAEIWLRRTMLLGGIETLAFAAAGWIFGREVGREAAKDAKADKDQAKKDQVQAEKVADDAKTDALRLASRINTRIGRTLVADDPDAGDLQQLAEEVERRWSAPTS